MHVYLSLKLTIKGIVQQFSPLQKYDQDFFQESSTISNSSILKNPLFFGLILTNFYLKKYYSFTSRIILYIAKHTSIFMPKRTQAEHNLIQKPGVQKIESIYFKIKSGNHKQTCVRNFRANNY